MARGIAIEIAKAAPPPEKLGKMKPGGEEEPMDEEAADTEAAELSAMEEFETAESTEDKLAAFKKLLDICGY